jgi:hypothetical protein
MGSTSLVTPRGSSTPRRRHVSSGAALRMTAWNCLNLFRKSVEIWEICGLYSVATFLTEARRGAQMSSRFALDSHANAWQHCLGNGRKSDLAHGAVLDAVPRITDP